MFSDEDWRNFANNQYLKDTIVWDQPDTANSIDPSMLDFQSRLCCNKQPRDCDCKDPITWEDVKTIPHDVDYDAYASNSICETCTHWWSPRCMPYRELAFNYLIAGTIPKEPIDGCQYYTPETIVNLT